MTGEQIEQERQAFETWMKVSVWPIQSSWDPTLRRYIHLSEIDTPAAAAPPHPVAVVERGMWAAWRDRASRLHAMRAS
jgi:hypothetical protein